MNALCEKGVTMTNAQIILAYMVQHDLDPETTILHTYETWKKLGFQVKRGEKSQHKITIWKYSSKKIESEDSDDEEKTVGRCFPKLSAFFTQDQVEKAEVKDAVNI